MATDRLGGKSDLEPLIDLGMVPIGGIYWDRPVGVVVQAPLFLTVSGGSGLVQLRDRYDAAMYSGYTFSGDSSPSYRRHVIAVADGMMAEQAAPGRIFEIGASDGVFLAHCRARGWTVAGVEPSHGLVAEARARGVEIMQGYVSVRWAAEHVAGSGTYQVVVMRHVLEHLDDPHDMFAAIGALAAADGTLLLELPSLECMAEARWFSNVFHEHVAYYSQQVLWDLLGGHGWGVVGYQRVGIHGGSHLLSCRRGGHRVAAPVFPRAVLDGFVAGFAGYREALRKLVAVEIGAGRRVAVYGASHRTPLLLSLAGMADAPLVAVYDKNRLLHGRFLPPSGTEIRDPVRMVQDRIDTLIICAISYQDEIIREFRGMLAPGGRFIALRGEHPGVVTADAASGEMG